MAEEDEAKDIQNVSVGPIHKLIAENPKSNSMVIKVSSKFSLYLFLVQTYIYIFHGKLTIGTKTETTCGDSSSYNSRSNIKDP